MLRRLKVKNFKLLRDVELEFAPGVPTVLIGPNASGKSTIVEVLDFLNRCGMDGLESALIAHGGISAIQTIGTREPIEIKTDWSVTPNYGMTWSVAIQQKANGNYSVISEALTDVTPPNETQVFLHTTDDGTRILLDETNTTTPVKDSHQLAFESFKDAGRYRTLFNLQTVLRYIRTLGTISTSPAWARASSERVSPRDAMVVSTQSTVGREGLGLATALYNLQINNLESWNTLEKAFRAEFPTVKRIVFPPDLAGSKISFAVEDTRFPERKILSSEMSDGMIAYLCLLSLLLDEDPMALALDEPDAHLHPSALRRFIALAHDSKDRTLIVATHSNALLDELQDPAASIRVVESTEGGARIRQLDAEALAAWREDYTLSDLRRTGLLDPANTAYGTDS